MKDYGLWQTNQGFQKGRVRRDGLAYSWVLRKTCMAWSTGYYIQTVNHRSLHQKLMMHFMVTRIT